LRPDAPLIGLVARFHPVKDHATFIEAMAILSKKRPDVHFLLVGFGVTPENQWMAECIAHHGLEAQTHLLGMRSDIPRLTAALDIACSSSWSEAFPNAVGEAMSCGVPCVVTDVGDSAWMIGGTGVVVPPRDPQGLAQAWERLFSMGADERRNLGAEARRRAEALFSLDTMIHNYEQLYRGLTEEGMLPMTMDTGARLQKQLHEPNQSCSHHHG
jgi:glycosyltransferase involved in cell wall biosynthesis